MTFLFDFSDGCTAPPLGLHQDCLHPLPQLFIPHLFPPLFEVLRLTFPHHPFSLTSPTRHLFVFCHGTSCSSLKPFFFPQVFFLIPDLDRHFQEGIDVDPPAIFSVFLSLPPFRRLPGPLENVAM